MSVIDTRIREAWDSGDPSALHTTAERLAAEGHVESAILDALEKLLLEVREAGADDEAEERIMGVMDRLSGWCHESGHLRTNRVGLPTEEEIAKLPRWARVAFAARCARRVLPLVKHRWPSVPDKYYLPLEGVIAHVERCASLGQHLPGTWSIRDDAVEMMHFAEWNKVIDVAKSAAASCEAEVYPQTVLFTVNAATFAVRASAPTHVAVTAQAIRDDLSRLTELSVRSQWHGDTPVSPQAFGPLWPTGVPTGWPNEELFAQEKQPMPMHQIDQVVSAN